MTDKNDLTTIYIARHGETVYNVEHITQGHVDSPLTEEGIKQAEALGGKLKDVHFDMVFSSDLLRAKRTAEIATLEKKLLVNTSHLLRERNYGRFDGRPARAFKEENLEMFEKLKTLSLLEKRGLKFGPDIESDNEVTYRMLLFLREAAVTYTGKTLLVVSHGGTMRAFLNHLGWSGEKELVSGAIKNAAYIKLVSDGVTFNVQEAEGIEKQ